MPARQSAARARPTPRPSAPRPRPKVVKGGAGKGIRWDRVGRVALLVVLVGVVVLYVGPAINFAETWHESKQRDATVKQLDREHEKLVARRKALRDPRSLEREARRLGLVRPGEKPFVVSGLPKD